MSYYNTTDWKVQTKREMSDLMSRAGVVPELPKQPYSSPVLGVGHDPFSFANEHITSRTDYKKYELFAYLDDIRRRERELRMQSGRQTYDRMGNPLNKDRYSDPNTKLSSKDIRNIASKSSYGQRNSPYDDLQNILYSQNSDPHSYDPHDPNAGKYRKSMLVKYRHTPLSEY